MRGSATICWQSDGLFCCLLRSSTSHPITPASSHQPVVYHSVLEHCLSFSGFSLSSHACLLCRLHVQCQVQSQLTDPVWRVRGRKTSKVLSPSLSFSHILASVPGAVCISKAPAFWEANRPLAISKELLGWNPLSKDTWHSRLQPLGTEPVLIPLLSHPCWWIAACVTQAIQWMQWPLSFDQSDNLVNGVTARVTDLVIQVLWWLVFHSQPNILCGANNQYFYMYSRFCTASTFLELGSQIECFTEHNTLWVVHLISNWSHSDKLFWIMLLQFIMCTGLLKYCFSSESSSLMSYCFPPSSISLNSEGDTYSWISLFNKTTPDPAWLHRG